MSLAAFSEVDPAAHAVAALEELVANAPVGDLLTLTGQLARLQALVTIRLVGAVGGAVAPAQGEEDRLLDVDEAAKLLKTTPAGLYKRADGLPFTVRQGRRLLFSLLGLRRYIAESQEGQVFRRG